MAHHISPQVRECIEACSRCHDICVETASHCLRMGGKHASADHIGALLDCAQACALSADFMLRSSHLHSEVCGVCAQACDTCAEHCEQMADGDSLMARCAEACRRCGDSCREMSTAAATLRTKLGQP